MRNILIWIALFLFTVGGVLGGFALILKDNRPWSMLHKPIFENTKEVKAAYYDVWTKESEVK